MKKLVLLVVGVFLFATNLINVNFFEGKNKIDILLSLDNVFEGRVKQIGKYSYLITNIKSDKVIQKEFNDKFINSIIISPQNNGIKVDVITKSKIKTSVALTPDGYGLRFRIVNLTLKSKDVNIQKVPHANDSGFDMFSYLMALLVLVILAGILWFIKRNKISLPSANLQMKVIMQKPIDVKNKVVLFEYQNRKYLMLIGNTNLLLDVFSEDTPVPKNEVEFEEMLKLSKKYDNIEQYIKNAEKLKGIDETI